MGSRTRSPRPSVPVAAVLLCMAIGIMGAPTAGQEGRAPAPPPNWELIEELVIGSHILADLDILDGTGHFSVRDGQRPDRFLMSRSVAAAIVTASDMMEYDLDGQPIDQRGRGMFGERAIHAGIYKARPDVRAVIHTHMASVLPFANSSVQLRPIYQMSAYLHAGAPIFDIRNVPGERGMLVSNMTSGAALAKSLGSATVALMRGHGAVVVGRSIPEAVSNIIHLDLNAKMQATAAALGAQLQYLTDEEAKSYGNGGPYERIWDHYASRLKR